MMRSYNRSFSRSSPGLNSRGKAPNDLESNLGSLPGPDDITRVVLPNGIIILARENFNSPSVVISGSTTAGNLFDSDEKLGLAYFTSLALMRGTSQRDFQSLYDALESAGANFGLSAGTHTSGFSGRALAEDLPLLLGLLSETLRQPIFPSEQIERLRAQLLTGLAIRAQDTGDMAAMMMDRILYESHPYSRPEDGYPETVNAITRDDLAEFHARYYGPRGMLIAVVGAVDPKQAVDKVQQALGDWQNSNQPDPPELPSLRSLDGTVQRKTTIPGKIQADIMLGAVGPERRAEDYLAASLGNSILGRFGMYGRIGDVVREQAGLAYYAYSNISGGMGPGPWYVSAGVDPLNIDKVIDLVRLEITRFVSEPVSDEELADSKANYIGSLPLSLETNSGVAGALINLERYSLGLDYYRRFPDQVNEITREQVLEAARRYINPDNLGIGVAGP
jgi:zinc protease